VFVVVAVGITVVAVADAVVSEAGVVVFEEAAVPVADAEGADDLDGCILLAVVSWVSSLTCFFLLLLWLLLLLLLRSNLGKPRVRG